VSLAPLPVSDLGPVLAVVTSNPVRFAEMYIPDALNSPAFDPADTGGLFY